MINQWNVLLLLVKSREAIRGDMMIWILLLQLCSRPL